MGQTIGDMSTFFQSFTGSTTGSIWSKETSSGVVSTVTQLPQGEKIGAWALYERDATPYETTVWAIEGTVHDVAQTVIATLTVETDGSGDGSKSIDFFDNFVSLPPIIPEDATVVRLNVVPPLTSPTSADGTDEVTLELFSRP